MADNLQLLFAVASSQATSVHVHKVPILITSLIEFDVGEFVSVAVETIVRNPVISEFLIELIKALRQFNRCFS